MSKSDTANRYWVAALISGVPIFLMLAFAPAIDKSEGDNFANQVAMASFINPDDSSKIEALAMYDSEPIFLPTALNKKAIAPKLLNTDSFDKMNAYDGFEAFSYTNLVLNKKESRLNKLNNIFYASIREVMPYYKRSDNLEHLGEKKGTVSISVLDAKTGEKIISENLLLEEHNSLSKFFVPTEVFMSVSPSLYINIADNISSSILEEDAIEVIREAINKAKIFQKIDSGYYKLIISP